MPKTTKPKTAKAKKGTVSVTADRGRLRLGWRHEGQRYFLFIGLPDSVTNRRVAAAKATQIELDILSGHFDPTLKRYKIELRNHLQTSVPELFEEFIQFKSKTVTEATLDKYRGLLKYLREFFGDRSISETDLDEAERFTDWYNSQNLSKVVIRERIGLLSACWEWAIGKAYVEMNPWLEMPYRIKVPPKQMPKPFTQGEIKAIVEAFRSNRYYRRVKVRFPPVWATWLKRLEVTAWEPEERIDLCV